MKLNYGEQNTPEETLDLYCRWIIEQEYESQERGKFLYCGKNTFEWYMIFYALRTLSLGGALLNKPEYTRAAEPYLDRYCSEQLPNGALSSNFRGKPAEEMTPEEQELLIRTGKLNLADNGTNCQELVQAAMLTADPERKKRYLDTVKKWLDFWVPVWALPDGSYGNGIWAGHKLNGTYSCAINVCSALAAYGAMTGEDRYVRNAEGFASFVCDHTFEDGRPVFFNIYPRLRHQILDDYGHIFYTLEGLCWTHFASKNGEIRSKIETFLKNWIFGKYGILRTWPEHFNWFDINYVSFYDAYENGEEVIPSAVGIRPGWKMAKSNGIPHLFSYYLKYIEDNAEIRDRFNRGVQYLCRPLDAMVNGVMANAHEHYGHFAVQSTGFAGLTVAEAIRPGFVFELVKSGRTE